MDYEDVSAQIILLIKILFTSYEMKHLIVWKSCPTRLDIMHVLLSVALRVK